MYSNVMSFSTVVWMLVGLTALVVVCSTAGFLIFVRWSKRESELEVKDDEVQEIRAILTEEDTVHPHKRAVEPNMFDEPKGKKKRRGQR